MEAELKPRVLLLKTSREGAEALEEVAEVLWVPVVHVVPTAGPEVLEAVKRAGKRAWLVFTSVNGVRVASKVVDLPRLVSELGAKVAAVGPRTAGELARLGVKVHLVPREYRGASLARELLASGAEAVVLLRSEGGAPELREALELGGARVLEVSLYRVVSNPLASSLALTLMERVDFAVYCSPSSVKAVAEAAERLGVKLGEVECTHIAIGPTTARTLKSLGVDAQYPREYTLRGVAELIKGLMEVRSP